MVAWSECVKTGTTISTTNGSDLWISTRNAEHHSIRKTPYMQGKLLKPFSVTFTILKAKCPIQHKRIPFVKVFFFVKQSQEMRLIQKTTNRKSKPRHSCKTSFLRDHTKRSPKSNSSIGHFMQQHASIQCKNKIH